MLTGVFVSRACGRAGSIFHWEAILRPAVFLSSALSETERWRKTSSKLVGGSLPPHIGIYVNLNRVNESESGSILGAFVDGRGQFMFQNLIPGDYEVRLIGNNFQPGEPRDKYLSKLIYNTKQKVSVGANSQQTVTLVIDLGQKESN